MEQGSPVVSVIIPTYNNHDVIPQCISSIHGQTYDNLEILVVDNDSTDGTQEILSNLDLRLHVEETSMPEARNKGAELANGDYYFHIDSDMKLTDSVVEECVALCEDRYDAVVVPERNIGRTYWAKCMDVGKEIKNKSEVGNLRFIDAEIYESIGRHDEDLVAGEDRDMHLRAVDAGAEVGYADSYILHNVGDISLLDYINDRLRYSGTTDKLLEKYDGPPQREKIDKEIMAKEILKKPVLSTGFLFMNVIAYLIYKLCKE